MKMGTDIHLRVQRKENDKWVWADGIGDTFDWERDDGKTFYSDRNYRLFSILADVRNGRGFAGVYTGEGFNPIAEPRGLPEDMRSMSGKEVWDAELGEHSYSWLTVKELVDYDWSQESIIAGVIHMKAYAEYMDKRRWKQYASPPSWAGSVSGYQVEVISNEEMEWRIKERLESDGPWSTWPGEYSDQNTIRYYTHLKWPMMYSVAAGRFWTITMPKLIKLARDNGGYENVRIVFGFDS